MGIYSKTALALEKKYKISYSRQAVRQRALKFPDVLLDIEEEAIDRAESVLFDLMKSEDERIRLKAIIMFLTYKGSKRGYNKSLNINANIESKVELEPVPQTKEEIEALHNYYRVLYKENKQAIESIKSN